MKVHGILIIIDFKISDGWWPERVATFKKSLKDQIGFFWTSKAYYAQVVEHPGILRLTKKINQTMTAVNKRDIMKHELYQNGFIIVENAIETITYRDYLRQFGGDKTTTPGGIAPRLHIRLNMIPVFKRFVTEELIPATLYYDLSESQKAEFEPDGECPVYELWSWGIGGNHPRKLEDWPTEDEVVKSMYESFEFNVERKVDAPFFYLKEEEALQQLADFTQRDVAVIKRYLRIKAAIKKNHEESVTRYRTIREQQKKKKQIEIDIEASTLQPDGLFLSEVAEIEEKLQGEEKSKALSRVFVSYLKRVGHPVISSDFWKVFRIVSKKEIQRII